MAWRYTFDGGPEKGIDTDHGHYQVVAMLAFARETLTRFPNVPRVSAPYGGHVLVLWDDKLVPEYGPCRYGLGYNECVNLQIIPLRDE